MNRQDQLYNRAILALAAELRADDRLAAPDASAELNSPVCGSRIRVDVTLDADDALAAYGQQVRACALGQSAAAVMARHAVGRKLPAFRALCAQMQAMLKEEGPPPDGDWSELAILTPARAHRSRHDSILLPFRAVIAAMEMALESRSGQSS